MSEPRPYQVVEAREGADLPAVLWLYGQARPETSTPAGELPRPSAQEEAMWGRMLGTDDLTAYMALDAHGGPAGLTCLLLLPNLGYDCRPTAFLEPMIVARAHRRQGVGRLLVEHALADARAASCHKVQVVSHKRHAHDGAHAFYRSLGFTPEAEGFRTYL